MLKMAVFIASLLTTCAYAQETAMGPSVTFQFVQKSHDERFFASTDDAAVIAAARAQLALPFDQRALHIIGAIEAGDGGVNAPWSWHFAPSAWKLSEFSMEVCDGWPSYIEEHLDEWLKAPGSFCPWASRVEAEVN